MATQSLTKPATLVWFRLDLRLADNPALRAAVERGGPVIPVYIWAPEEDGAWPPGAASKWWLHQSLLALGQSLAKAGSPLILRRGNSGRELLALAAETGADAIFWNRRYEPAAIARDQCVMRELERAGYTVKTFNSALLFEPGTVLNNSGRPFQVFTPFWRACLAQTEPAEPVPAPATLRPPMRAPGSLELRQLQLEPAIDWAQGIQKFWTPGPAGAKRRLDIFCAEALFTYERQRNVPAVDGTSQLSPHLHFGEVSPRQVWKAVRHAAEPRLGAQWRKSQFLTELGWREFAHQLLVAFPHTLEQPLRPDFQKFPWRDHPEWLRAWQKGRTGFPLVDAGMRQLWHVGWMHNRVRMVVGSFLVKNLMLHWLEGARWFHDTLVDADLANNVFGWQWTAGCGADAAPFFRIFNPVSQGQKFDPEGDYIRAWIPELRSTPAEAIHTITEGRKTEGELPLEGSVPRYPSPIVSAYISRQVALEAYGRLKT